MENRKCLMFDFDGVIGDSFDLAYENYKQFEPGLTKEEFRDHFDNNIYEWIGNLASKFPDRDMAEEIFDFYKTRILDGIKVFDEMEDVVRELKENYLLVIISSKHDELLKRFLEHHSLDNLFADILGGETHKSKVVKIDMILDKHKLEAKDCLFVTDTVGDVEEAREKGIDTVAVSWGFHSRKKLEESKPYKVVDKPGELLVAVGEYFG